MAQSAPATAQTVEAYVGETMDDARMGPVHWQVLALVASGYFCDVLDFTIFGALVPDLIKSGFVTQQQVPWIGSVTVAGLFVGTLGQGEFTDRFGRKAVYQFNLLLFGLATHGQGQRALDLLQRMGLRTVPLATLRTDAASDTHSDPIGIVLRNYPGRVIAGMICFFAF